MSHEPRTAFESAPKDLGRLKFPIPCGEAKGAALDIRHLTTSLPIRPDFLLRILASSREVFTALKEFRAKPRRRDGNADPPSRTPKTWA